MLRSNRAEAELVRMFEAGQGAGGGGRIDLAQALWRIRPEPRWRDAVADMLASAGDAMLRMSAARALRDFHDSGAVAALTAALDDPEPLVRHHAARGLLKLHGLADEATDRQHMIYRVMATDPARRDAGRRAVVAAIAGLPIAP